MNLILKHLDKYFSRKILQYGATPLGVDWKNSQSQLTRFRQVLKILDGPSGKRFSLNDLGCGYGGLYAYLRQQGSTKFSYRGYDLSAGMVEEGRRLFKRAANFRIKQISHPLAMPKADYSVASGIFNNKNGFSNISWRKYILETLHCLDSASRKGFSFNILSSYSDKNFRRPDLYYADPLFYFDYCKKKFSPAVSLNHSYGLYEFTLLVFKRGL